jgi:hypothetical protein
MNELKNIYRNQIQSLKKMLTRYSEYGTDGLKEGYKQVKMKLSDNPAYKLSPVRVVSTDGMRRQRAIHRKF